MLVDKFR